jgi:prevent-host-death family protein
MPQMIPQHELTALIEMTRLMTSFDEVVVKSWPVQDAKARFSELLKASVTEGPQVVTLRGVETAVLVAVSEWRSLCERARPGLKALLLAPQCRGDLNVPPRGRLRRRTEQIKD